MYLYNRMLFSREKEAFVLQQGQTLKTSCRVKEAVTRGHIFYDSTPVKVQDTELYRRKKWWLLEARKGVTAKGLLG